MITKSLTRKWSLVTGVGVGENSRNQVVSWDKAPGTDQPGMKASMEGPGRGQSRQVGPWRSTT